MSFQLVPKSVTLNDLERRNGRYFALFEQIRVACGRTVHKFTFAVSSPDEFLYIVWNHDGELSKKNLNTKTNYLQHVTHITDRASMP